MAEPNKDSAGKGKAFFERAEEVAGTGNWDFAIELYLEGVQREPDNLEHGHKPLREVSLKRTVQGGKGPGMMEALKRRPAKDPLVSLINAEYLLSKEPGSVAHMEAVLDAAKKLELKEVIKWVCDIMLESQRQAAKPNKRILVLLTQTFHDMEDFACALQACNMGLGLNPNDPVFVDAAKELSAKYTIKKGGYGEEGDFTKGVKDMDKQKELAQKESLIKSGDYLEQQIEKARQEYEESPTVPGKINGYVEALLKKEDESYENTAIDVLDKANRDTSNYAFKMRIGDIKIRQMTRRYRKLAKAGDKKGAKEAARLQLAFELEEFAERVANYPTDLALKYELGRRQLLGGNVDEAISLLQQAQREPRRAVNSMTMLGQAFARKDWHHEAAETFERALQHDLGEDKIKEIRYLLGDSYEKLEELEKAQEQFSEVAQIEFTYKDTRDRLDAIRKKLSQGEGDQ